MFSKILGVALLVVCSQAAPQDYHQATSYAAFNENHNTVHHVHSAPALVKAAVAVPVHAAPIHAAPLHIAPAPIAYKSIAPIAAPHGGAQSYSSISLGHTHAAPVAQYAAPVAHYAAPVAHYAAPIHSAPLLVKSAPVVLKSVHHEEEHYAPAKYEFAYGVEDHHTGDIHSHKEARDGDLTHGEYSLHEADGTVRTVKYSVDKHSGFNAIVERSGHATHAQPAKAIVAAPIIKAYAAAPSYHHHY